MPAAIRTKLQLEGKPGKEVKADQRAVAIAESDVNPAGFGNKRPCIAENNQGDIWLLEA